MDLIFKGPGPYESPALKRQAETYPPIFEGRVPLKVRVLREVKSDIPFSTLLANGEVSVWVNSYGAVSACLRDGNLGLKPDEFEVTEWHPLPEKEKRFNILHCSVADLGKDEFTAADLAHIFSEMNPKAIVLTTSSNPELQGSMVKAKRIMVKKMTPVTRRFRDMMDMEEYSSEVFTEYPLSNDHADDAAAEVLTVHLGE